MVILLSKIGQTVMIEGLHDLGKEYRMGFQNSLMVMRKDEPSEREQKRKGAMGNL